MENFNDKLVEVCDSCKQASCWYGKFMCGCARSAGTELKTVKELKEFGYEHPENWSDKKMEQVFGQKAPFGYKKK